MPKLYTKTIAAITVLGAPFILSATAFAADSDITKTQDFIKSVIKVAAGFAGLIAAGFFVVGGFVYITSSGDPEKLHKAKHTLIWSAIGLAIVIAAFAISTIVTDLATGAFGK